jgi:hypothetical protein
VSALRDGVGAGAFAVFAVVGGCRSAGRAVMLRLRVRRFFCDNTGCGARTSSSR